MEYMYEKILSEIEGKIRSGEYPEGHRLPTEKELEEAYHVSRITSKKAMDLLAERGLIYRVRGRGSYVNKRKEWFTEEKEVADTNSVTSEVQSEKKPRLIGVILDNFYDDFGVELLKGIAREARSRQYEIMLRCTYGVQEEENHAIESLKAAGAAGLLLVSVQNETYNASLLKLALNQYPTVLIDRKMTGIQLPCITTDNYRAARELTNRLISRGNHKLCMLTHSCFNTPTIRERYQGFVDSILENDHIKGCKCILQSYHASEEINQHLDLLYEKCTAEMEELILQNEDCTGFFAVEAKLAWILDRTLSRINLHRDIVYFDRCGLGEMKHGIANVRQDETAMGIKAVAVLDQILTNRQKPIGSFENLYIPYQLD